MPWLLDEVTVCTVTTPSGVLGALETKDGLEPWTYVREVELVVDEMIGSAVMTEVGALEMEGDLEVGGFAVAWEETALGITGVAATEVAGDCGLRAEVGTVVGVFDEARAVLEGALTGAFPMVLKEVPSTSGKKIVSAFAQQSQDRFPSQQYRPGEHWSIASLPVAVPSMRAVN